MYQPKYIIIKNFGSIKEMRYDFKIKKSQIIQGKNLDDKGQRNNGVGKSSFIDAIGFSTTGLSLRNLTIEELIRDNENESYLEFFLKNIKGDRELLIKRTLNRKKPQLIEIFLNGNPVHKDEHDVNARNQFIIDEIGISKEDLFQFFLITKDRYKSYFKLSDTDKKAITGRFSNSNVVDGVFLHIENDIKIKEDERQDVEKKITSLESKIESYKQVVEDLKSNSGDDYKEKLKQEYQTKISDELLFIDELGKQSDEAKTNIGTVINDICDKKNSLIKDEEFDVKYKLIEELDSQIVDSENELNRTIESITKNITTNESNRTNIRKNINEYNNIVGELDALLAQLNSQLKSSIECPDCQYEFILESNKTVKEIKDEILEIEGTKKTVIEALNQFKADLSLVDDIIKNISNSVIDLRNKHNNSISEIRNQKTLLETWIRDSKKENKNIQATIDEFEKKLNKLKLELETIEDKISNSYFKIESLNNQINDVDTIDNDSSIKKYSELISETEIELEAEINIKYELVQEIQRLNEWILKFKAFKSYLANLSLKNIQDLMNSYLNKMNTDLSVEIDGYKQKGKKVSEKITETILRNGIAIGSYGRFSGGERGRIDVGSILANQTLINNNASPRGLDLVLIDEILESLDSIGIESVIRSMNNIDKTLILITQNEINTLPEQTITFVKQNNETLIEQQ